MGNYNIYRQMVNLGTDGEMEEILSGVSDFVRESRPAIDVFFNYFNGRVCFMSSLFTPAMFYYKTPEEFIEGVRQQGAETIRREVLSFYDCYRHSPAFYGELFQNRERLGVYLNGIPGLHGLKFKLRNFLDEPEKPVENLVHVMRQALPCVEKLHSAKRGRIEELAANCRTGWEQHGGFPALPVPGSEAERQVGRIFLSVAAHPGLRYIMRQGPDVFICLGLDYSETHRQQPSYCEYVDFYVVTKALGDELRFEIFELLNQKDMYLTEIAAAFRLPPSAVSYHINCLVRAKLVTIRTQGRKIYYSANRPFLGQIARFVNAAYGAAN